MSLESEDLLLQGWRADLQGPAHRRAAIPGAVTQSSVAYSAQTQGSFHVVRVTGPLQ